MIFVTFGLWDHCVATGNEPALKLYDGAVTTMRDRFGRLRQAKWLSYYCHTHRVPAKGYHRHHINLFRRLHWQTGSPVLAHQQDTLINDYPDALLLPKGSVAPFDRRAIVNGRPMVHITAGGLTGYWAPAGPVLTDGH